MSLENNRVDKLLKLNKYLKGHTTHYCPIVSSKKIKDVLINRANELGVSMEELAIRADVSWNSLKKFYLECEEPESRPSLRPTDLMKVGELIGIRIRTNVILTPIENIDVNDLIKRKYIPHEQRKKNKKLG